MKLTKFSLILAVLALIFSTSVALAQPDRVPAHVNKTPEPVNVIIPALAVEVADNVFSLGTAIDPVSGQMVEGYAIIHPKTGQAKPPWAGGGKGTGETKCYSFLAKDAKWKTVEPWLVNTSNNAGLSESFVFDTLTVAIDEWEDAADGAVDGVMSEDILGNGSTTASALSADTSAPDGQNEVYFDDVSSSGAIAVTVVWGIFGGPPSGRQLVEWDQVYDDVDFPWSSTGEAGKMDFENIAQHELGHSVGLGHPDDSCTEETMYRFASEGETNKRDLNAGDIAGINELY